MTVTGFSGIIGPSETKISKAERKMYKIIDNRLCKLKDSLLVGRRRPRSVYKLVVLNYPPDSDLNCLGGGEVIELHNYDVERISLSFSDAGEDPKNQTNDWVSVCRYVEIVE